MNKLYILILAIFVISSCESLDQSPSNIASSNSLTDYTGVLNAAYFYQHSAATPLAVMGDFRADNAFMQEPPFDEFDLFGPGLTAMEDQFFGPMYTGMYRSILSANNVIENSENATQVAEARFLRALSYFKLTKVFGEVPVNLSATPSTTDMSILTRQSVASIYSDVIIPDFEAAIAGLSTTINNGRASRFAAEGMLAKAYIQIGDFGNALPLLTNILNGAGEAGLSLRENFAEIFGFANDLNSEIIYATQISSSVPDEYGFSEFWSWSGGLDTKSLLPLDADLISAFDASPGDLRRAVTIDETVMASPKFPQTDGPDHDWIELRLADVMLMYAEALIETGGSAADALGALDAIRMRAGVDPLDPSVISSQADVRQAIQDERRLELAYEGHRWFDLVRTGTVDQEMGETVNSNCLLYTSDAADELLV